jgi:hypothetical protein
MKRELLNDDDYESALLRKHGSNTSPYNSEKWSLFDDQCWIRYMERIHTISSLH